MPIWKLVVDSGIPLSEIQRWDLEDIYTALSFIEMQKDYEAAESAFERKRIESMIPGKK